jgi:16S rRNA (guanine527-N7)-methyltransferase
MDTARIAELLEPFLQAPITGPTSNPCHSERGQRPGEEPAVLSPTQLQHISTYIDILRRWNARINLTAIRDPEEIVRRHFGESLFAARHLFPSSANSAAPAARPTIADLGSGAGFPGVPLKLWAPQVSLTLIESNHKKATFLREVVRALALTDANVKSVRAESLSETFNLVTLRAVDDFASILPAAAALVAPGGSLGLLIGSAQIGFARASLPHVSWSDPVPVPLSTSRVVFAGSRPL